MDLKLIETGNGGDLVFNGTDIEVVQGFQNMPYIGLFGGNPVQSTQTINPSEERFDFWGNDLFFVNDESIQFNSSFERALSNTALNSTGRLALEQAAERDLNFMSDFANISIDAVIESVDRFKINITLREPDQLESNEFVYIWDNTKMDLTQI
tara:strand:+ start:3956 stop:4414 length:459 start_codon:yes stop_codon:yes gene_type:complete